MQGDQLTMAQAQRHAAQAVLRSGSEAPAEGTQVEDRCNATPSNQLDQTSRNWVTSTVMKPLHRQPQRIFPC